MISKIFNGKNSLRFSNYFIKNKINNFKMSTVAANTVKIIFVDQEGNRATVPVIVGTTLLDAAKQHKIDLEGPCRGGSPPTDVRRTEKWVETVYGEGPSCFFCHVQISSKYNNILPEQSLQAIDGLTEVWGDEYVPTSRLACLINVKKEHDGMVVLVPDAPPTDII